jgi:hypothetical protein
MFNLTRIRIQWGGARSHPARWFLGLVGLYQRKQARGYGLVLSLRGLLIWSVVGAFVGYFAGGGYYWWKLEQRPHNYVRYGDVLLYPLSAEKRAEVRELQGKAFIAGGMDEFAAKQWHRAMMSLGLGLERYPRDLNARLKLAQLFLGSRVRLKAQETLMRGLDHGWPGRPYLEAAIETAAAGEDHELVVEICDRGLALHDGALHPAADRRWLVERRLRALIAEKRVDEALATVEREQALLGENLFFEVRILALLNEGKAAEAASEAEAWRLRSPSDPSILRLLARTYREAGRIDDMRRTLAAMRADAPADPRSHVFSVIQTLLAGGSDEGRAMVEDYVFRFGGTESNYVLLVEPLAEIGRAEELELLLAAAAERGMKDPRLAAARLQVLIGERRWSEAARQIESIRASLPPGATGRATLVDFYQHLIAAAADPADGAQSGLTDYVRVRQLPMVLYRQSVEVLRRAGRAETALRVLNFAEGVYPNNAYLATARDEIRREIEAGKAAAAASRVVVAPAAALSSQASFEAEVDRVADADGPSTALRLFRDLRQARPAWLEAADEPIARRELLLHGEGDDLAALQGAARIYLTSDLARKEQVIALATRLHGRSRSDSARLLLTEVLKRFPGDGAASRLMALWFPPVKAAPVPETAPGGAEAAVGADRRGVEG